MRQRKFLAMITATTMTLTTLLSPLTILALEDEITLEEESEEVLSESDGLEEVVTADENTTNSADPIEDNHTYTTDIGSIQIESSETELPAGLHAVITKTDESYAPYPGNESVSYSVRLLDKQSDEFIPEDGNGVYIIHLEIPTEFKDHELVLSQVKNIEESAESPAFEAIDFETNENGTELIIHSNALGGIFVLTDLSKKAAYESGVTQKDETNDVIQDSAPNYKSIFKSEDGDLRLKYGHSKMERVVYEVSKSDDYSSIMQKEGVKDFQTFNVRLLDKNGEDTKEQNEYMFRVFIPEEYQNYRVGIYRIYEPGEYTIHTKNERKHIISKTRFAVEIDSSINYINNTVHWDSDDLGIYILGIKESMDPVKKPATTKNEDGIICQTADGEEIRIENFDSNPPAGVFAQVIKEQEKPYSVSYSPRLYDSWNDMYNPAGPGLKYTMSFDLPEKFIGHNLELVMKEAKGFSGGSSSVYGSQHIPVEYELNQEGTRLTMHPVRLDRTFMLTDIELEAQALEDNKGDANATDRPGDSSSTVTNKPSVTVNASTYLKLATQDSRYGSATAGPLKGDFKKDVFLLIEKASQNYEPHPGKKSSSIAIQLLDNDNHEYTFDEKDKEYYRTFPSCSTIEKCPFWNFNSRFDTFYGAESAISHFRPISVRNGLEKAGDFVDSKFQ